MMKRFIRASVSKRVVPKIIDQLVQVEKTIEAIGKTKDTDVELTLLIKLGNTYNVDKPAAEEKNKGLKTYWKNLFGPKTEFGFFHNPEIGTVFVAGPLSELFLHDVYGKKLGALTEAPYGILRGLGISEPKATYTVKKLNEGKYLLLIRATHFDLNSLGVVLDKTA